MSPIAAVPANTPTKQFDGKTSFRSVWRRCCGRPVRTVEGLMRSVARRRRGDRGKHTNAALSSGRARAAALRAHARRLCRRQDSDRTRRSHISILESAPGPCCPLVGEDRARAKVSACLRKKCWADSVCDVVTDAAKAIVRTALSRDARKIDRFARGPTKGGAMENGLTLMSPPGWWSAKGSKPQQRRPRASSIAVRFSNPPGR